MPLTQSFTTSQTLGESDKINLTDTSTGTDVAVVSRRVTFTDYNGDTFVEEGTATTYEVWDNFPGTTTITLDVLAGRDRAFNVRVDWVNISGTVLYTSTVLQNYVLYAKSYFIDSIKAQSNNNKLKNHANFYLNLLRLEISIKESADAILLLDDITSSQAALNRAKQIVDNPSNLY